MREKDERNWRDRYEMMPESKELTKKEKWVYGSMFMGIILFAMTGEVIIDWILNLIFK